MTDPVVGLVLEGRYRLEERLARGGMSTVYAATDLRLHRTVAVKIMADHLVHDPTFVDRFTREARAAAMLSHPNVVSVSDQGSDQGLVFLVMELVRGRTLRDLLHARGRLTVGEAFAVLEPVLAGLTAAHRAGIVHRDIKPENVLIGDRRRGQGRRLRAGPRRRRHRAEPDRRRPDRHGRLPVPRAARARPRRRPHRHLRGRHRALRDAHRAPALRQRHPAGRRLPARPPRRPPAVGRRPGLPPQVDELVARTTRRDPAGRPVDAGAFLAELADLRKRLGIEPVPVPTGRSTAGPGTLRPTNRPTRPRHPSDPMTEVLGRSDRGAGRTSMLPGMGAGPTTHVNGRRPLPERPRPGVPQHIRRRRARFAFAIVLLLAITIGAVGWWLGSGRWTNVPELLGKQQDVAINLVQQAGLDADCCTQQWSEKVPAGQVIRPIRRRVRPSAAATCGWSCRKGRSASGSTPRW